MSPLAGKQRGCGRGRSGRVKKKGSARLHVTITDLNERPGGTSLLCMNTCRMVTAPAGHECCLAESSTNRGQDRKGLGPE